MEQSTATTLIATTMTTARKIQRLLKKHNMTQTDLSFKCRISQPNLNLIVNGKTAEPRRATLEKIAKAFGVKWTDLLTD